MEYYRNIVQLGSQNEEDPRKDMFIYLVSS